METRKYGSDNPYSGGFKSYYVVWKPLPTGGGMSELKGLNRTMQYGNK